MPGDPATDRDPDRRDLSPPHPDPGQTGNPFSRYREGRKGRDHHLLERAQVTMDVTPLRSERHDGVADQLSGAVVRHLAAACDLADRHVAGSGDTKMSGIRAPAERVDGPMLEEQERVGPTAEPARDETLLPGERLVIVDVSRDPNFEELRRDLGRHQTTSASGRSSRPRSSARKRPAMTPSMMR